MICPDLSRSKILGVGYIYDILTLYITLAGDWQIFISDGHLGDWLGFELFEFIRKESITFALSLGIAEL